MAKIVIALVVKSMHSTPQNAIWTSFRVPIVAMWDCDLLGIKQKKTKN